MKNLDSLFAAYLVGWAIFFGYCVAVGRRMTMLRKEVEQLKNMLTRN
jgi:CcmD family protein